MSKVYSPKEPVRMKLIDALRNANKSEKNISCTYALYSFIEYFYINHTDLEEDDEKFDDYRIISIAAIYFKNY